MAEPARLWREQLEKLLGSLFDDIEFRRWLAVSPNGDDILHAIPASFSSFAELLHGAVSVLHRRGILDVAWFERLMAMFPHRCDDIRRVLDMWIKERPVGIPSPEPRYRNDEMQSLGRALEAAFAEREELVVRGASTATCDQQILELRRAIRRGPQLKPGDNLHAGRYRLIEAIGSGGCATVWKAYDRELRHLLALKVLHGQWSGDRGWRERFIRGARNMARMNHTGIVRILGGVSEEDGYLSFAMEYLERGDLRKHVLVNGMNARAAIELGIKLCSALEHAHQNGAVHRDVKPANVLLDGQGNPKLTDFDLVRVGDTTGGTRTGVGLGSYIYAAPECMQDAANVDVRADVFSAGMTILFCLLREDPQIEVLMDPDVQMLGLPLGDTVRRIIGRAIQRRASSRFASMTELRQALQIALESGLLAALPEDAPQAGEENERSYRWLIAWVGGDQSAGKRFYQRFGPLVTRFFRSKIADKTVVADLVQMVFLELLRKKDLEAVRSIRALVLGIATNVLRAESRRRQREMRITTEDPTAAELYEADPDGLIQNAQEHRLLMKSLRRLPIEHQIVLEMIYWENLSAGEVAQILGIPEGTLRARLRVARERLARTINSLADSVEVMEATTRDPASWLLELRAYIDQRKSGAPRDHNRK